ncbi:MAG TPA: hypothetical protein VMU17_02465, partial [Elusimicrobiota bacterium]|nr:hypothetical protein [Elusimicrobiota bacterium]
TGRWCPKCAQKLHHGRVRSRQLVLTVCPTCEMYWTDLASLKTLDEALERALRFQIETMLQYPTGAAGGYAAAPAAEPEPRPADTGIAGVFRRMASVMDNMADKLTGKSRPPAPKPAMARKTTNLFESVRPSGPPERTPAPEPVVESRATPIVERPAPTPAPSTAPAPRPPSAVERPVSPPVVQRPPVELPAPADIPAAPLPIEAPEERPAELGRPAASEPTTEIGPEPVEPPAPTVQPPAPIAEPATVKPATVEQAAPMPPPEPEPPVIRQPEPKGEAPAAKPEPTSKPKPEAASLSAKPVKSPARAVAAKALPQPSGGGFLSKLSAIFKPKPRPVKPKIAKPAQPAMSTPVPAPVKSKPAKTPEPPSAPAPEVVTAPEPREPPLIEPAEAMAPAAPAQQPEPLAPVQKAPEEKPAPPPSLLDIPVVPEIIEDISPLPPVLPPEKPPEPEKRKPAAIPSDFREERKPAAKRAPPREPKTTKVRGPILHRAILWLPSVLVACAFAVNVFGDAEFDLGLALVWSVAMWAVGSLIRLAWIYPFGNFQESSMAELAGRPARARWRGIPVLLTGTLKPDDEMMGKKIPMRLSDGTGEVALNRFGRIEIIPRLFGVSDLARLPRDSVTIKGWYRQRATPYVEVSEARTPKGMRQSFVRGMRWAVSVTLLIISLVILLTAS